MPRAVDDRHFSIPWWLLVAAMFLLGLLLVYAMRMTLAKQERNRVAAEACQHMPGHVYVSSQYGAWCVKGREL